MSPINSLPTLIKQYENGKWRSNAQTLINQIPVIEVDGHVAICDGGGGALGHPTEFIQLDHVYKAPAVCKYCGLRFKMAHGHGHGDQKHEHGPN